MKNVPVLTDDVREHLANISPHPPWHDWFLIPDDHYVIKWRKVNGCWTDGVLHTSNCSYAAKQKNTKTVRWEEMGQGELVCYWWSMATSGSEDESDKNPPKLMGFLKFCPRCVVLQPHFQKAKEIYEQAYPGPGAT